MNRPFLLAPIALMAAAFASAAVPPAPVNVQLVFDDAKAVRRVAEVAGRDLPRNILEKIVTEDVDLLRGKQSDGTFTYAHYEMEESGRKSDDFTVGSTLTRASLKEDFVYRLVITSPSRRFVVRRNKRIYLDHLEIETTPLDGSTKVDTIPVGLWLEPGSRKDFELGGVMRHANAVAYARVDEKEGAASLALALVKAKVRDNSDSPYLSAVQNSTLLLESLKKGDASNARTGANMVMGSLQSKLAPPEIAPRVEERLVPQPCPPSTASSGSGSMEGTPAAELVVDLQGVEDLLTGTEGEKREGLDKLHQLIRRLRSQR